MFTRALILFAVMIASAAPTRAAEESFGHAIKRIFSTPTPTPSPRKKKSPSSATKASPSPSASPKKKSSPAPEAESPEPSATASVKKKKTSSSENEAESAPHGSKTKKSSASPSPSASPNRKKKSSPTPEADETPSRRTSSSPTPSPTATPEEAAESPSPLAARKHGAPNATLATDEIKGFENFPAKAQKLLASALELTTRNLDYKYGSDDPASGGMDCSGFVYFVLRQNGVSDVPRDSSEQYIWLRRARQFEPVLSQKDDSFELENLKPGDLLFWTGTYSIERDPPITHAMIYLGRERKTGQRVMVGSSDGRVYQGESRNGVSVFDFKIQRTQKPDEGKLHPTFIGYGHIPGF